MAELELMSLDDLKDDLWIFDADHRQCVLVDIDDLKAILETARAAHEFHESNINLANQLHVTKLAKEGAQMERDQLREENDKLREAIKKQANAFRSGMDSAKKHASHMLQDAAQLNAESKPEVVDSERQANALLTEENERLKKQLRTARREERTLVIKQAEERRLLLGKRYQDRLARKCSEMGGNADWFRLEGAASVVDAIRALGDAE